MKITPKELLYRELPVFFRHCIIEFCHSFSLQEFALHFFPELIIIESDEIDLFAGEVKAQFLYAVVFCKHPVICDAEGGIVFAAGDHRQLIVCRQKYA